MKTQLFVIILLISLCRISAQTKNFLDQPYLETSAKADSLVIPDRIYLGIRIMESDTKGRTSVEELERRMVDRLRELGIDTETRLSLADLSSDFKKYFLRGQQVLKDKAFELVVHNADTAGRVLFELEKLGIANLSLNRVEYSAIESLQLLLKASAVKKAQQQARAMTDALGQSLGPAIYISDSGGYGPVAGAPRMRMYAETAAAQDSYIPTGSEFRKIKVEASVQVTFRLE